MTLSNVRKQVITGWRWLNQGAFAAMPLWMRERLRSGRPLTLFHRALDGSMQVETFDGQSVETLPDSIRLEHLDAETHAALDAWTSRRRALVILKSPKILVRDVELPRAATAHLDETIELSLHKQSPIVPEALVWTWRLVAIAKDQIIVRIWMAKRQTLDEIEAQFARAGFLPPSVAATSDEGPVILHEGEDGSRDSEWSRNRRALWLGLGALATIPLTTATAATVLTRAELAQEAQSTEQRAAAMEIVREGQQASRAREKLVALDARPAISEGLQHLLTLLEPSDQIQSIRLLGGRFLGVTVATSDRDALLARASASGVQAGAESDGDAVIVQLEVPLP